MTSSSESEIAWVRIDVERTCAQQIERCADHFEAAATDLDRLTDAIRCGHLAAMAAMIGALMGSAGVGAYSDKLAARHLAYYRSPNRESVPYPDERTMGYSDLLHAIQQPGRLEYADPVVFSPEEAELAGALDHYRGLIDHPKPTSWSVPADNLEQIVRFVPDLVERVVGTSHRFFDEHSRIKAAAARIRGTA